MSENKPQGSQAEIEHARAVLQEQRERLLSLPNVVVGKHRTVWCTKDMPCRVTRFFDSKLGTFCIEVNIRPCD